LKVFEGGEKPVDFEERFGASFEALFESATESAAESEAECECESESGGSFAAEEKSEVYSILQEAAASD
jgi:hypothetical protein